MNGVSIFKLFLENDCCQPMLLIPQKKELFDKLWDSSFIKLVIILAFNALV